LPGRRIWFLAINHDKHRHLADEHLRRALSLAVPREEILNRFFRAGLGDTVHRSLHGPYPVGSWACDNQIEAELNKRNPRFDADQARALVVQAKKKGISLSLKYPNDDPAVEEAMQFLADHLGKTLEIRINLQKLSPRQLREAVEKDRDYELAYYHHDYADDTFRLWPLLDSRSAYPGGRNYLGYRSPRLEKLFHEAASHRDFEQVRKITHTIHKVFLQEVPFIPLWQLDRHLALSQELELSDGNRILEVAQKRPLRIDPLRIFSTVEYWRLRRR
jgi:peptide/nickel transport system substrate-binding protein